jgi:hypothetical protein
LRTTALAKLLLEASAGLKLTKFESADETDSGIHGTPLHVAFPNGA